MDEQNFNYLDDEIVHTVSKDYGFLKYTIAHDHKKYGNYVELRQIFINQESRKKGLGKEFVLDLIKIAQGLGIKKIYCRSSASKEEVFGKFMEAMGFEITIESIHG